MRRNPNSTLAFKQKVIRDLKTVEILPKHLLVCVSGGVDSIVLLSVLADVQRLFGFQLSVGHVHHGLVQDQKLAHFRDQSQKFVAEVTRSLGFDFYTNTPKVSQAKSEAELRKFRFAQLEEWKKAIGASGVVSGLALGHHAEDLLETQFMRLLRGSSQLGLGAMSVWSNQQRLRPLLNMSKVEILDYAKQRGLEWIEDPSNSEMGPLRNRIRVLLRDMDHTLPGASKNLYLSLQRIVRWNASLERSWLKPCLTIRGIDRRRFMELPKDLKLQVLAIYAREMSIENYTSGQLEELRKRLDQKQKSLTFNFLGRSWDVSLDSISVK